MRKVPRPAGDFLPLGKLCLSAGVFKKCPFLPKSAILIEKISKMHKKHCKNM